MAGRKEKKYCTYVQQEGEYNLILHLFFFKKIRGLNFYHCFFVNLQIFALAKKQVFSSFSISSDCEDAAWRFLPTGACC